MKKYFVVLFFLLGSIFNSQGQGKVSISPEYPIPGDSVIIIYHPNVMDGSVQPVLDFTYSNFYELPLKISMQKTGSDWKVAFKLPPYAVLATFVVNDGDKTIKPSDKRHYEIVVYNRKRERVKNSYLYEAYSLSAQEGSTPDLKENQAALFKEELQHYPDNYQAKLVLLSYKISKVPENRKAQLYKEANEIIANKFYTDPGKMAYTNLTTMGYLIMGENTRLDSLRKVIRKKYPTSEAGYELRIGDLAALKDSTEMVSGLESLLTNENEKNRKYLTGAHKILFEYEARKGNLAGTLHHLSYLNDSFTPYTPSELKHQAEVLYQNSIALDTALALVKESMSYVDTFPITLIRYFPETGYLPAYVSKEKRRKSIKEVTGQLQSLRALILHKQGKDKEAGALMVKTINISNDNETLKNAGIFYNDIQDFESAFNAYRKASYNDPGDTLAYKEMKTNYKEWKGNMQGLDKYEQAIEEHWMAEMNLQLRKEIISKPLPDVLSNYVDMKGNPVSPKLFQNKIVIMDFWATWCGPCMEAMPYMEQVYEKFKSDPEVVFMIVNSGAKNELSDAQNWWGNKKFSFPVYYNKDKAIGDKLGFNVIPATFIIDRNGNIRFKTIGFEGKGMTRKLTAEIEMLKGN